MVELEMDNNRIVDFSKDPITEEFVFEFKEKKIGDKFETQMVQRIPISVVAHWSKLMYHDLYEKISADFDDEQAP